MITRLLQWCDRPARTYAESSCGVWLVAACTACTAATAVGAALAAAGFPGAA